MRKTISSIKTFFVQGWRWRSLARQRKALAGLSRKARKKELKRLDSKIDLSRREFLGAARDGGIRLGMLGLGAGAVGGTVWLVNDLQSRSRDAVRSRKAVPRAEKDPLLQRHKIVRAFESPQKYVAGLLKEAGVQDQEITQVRAKNPGPTGLYALICYGVLKKAGRKQLMSARYSDFIKVVAALVREGNIKLKSADRFTYERKTNTLSFNAAWMLKQTDLSTVEFSLIHELFHVYQDYKKMSLPVSLREAMAYLAAADYQWHLDPGLIHPTHWINIYMQANQACNTEFSPPADIVKDSIDRPLQDPALQKNLEKIRKAYFPMMIFVGSINRAVIEAFKRELSKVPVGRRETLMEGWIKPELDILMQKPLREHYLSAEKGGEELMRFATHVQLYAEYLCRGEHEQYAAEILHHYFIEIWKDDFEALLDEPRVDMILAGDGVDQ